VLFRHRARRDLRTRFRQSDGLKNECTSLTQCEVPPGCGGHSSSRPLACRFLLVVSAGSSSEHNKRMRVIPDSNRTAAGASRSIWICSDTPHVRGTVRFSVRGARSRAGSQVGSPREHAFRLGGEIDWRGRSRARAPKLRATTPGASVTPRYSRRLGTHANPRRRSRGTISQTRVRRECEESSSNGDCGRAVDPIRTPRTCSTT